MCVHVCVRTHIFICNVVENEWLFVLFVVVFFFFFFYFFFFNDTATTEIYPLSLHDALPILPIIKYHYLQGITNNGFLLILIKLDHLKFQDRKSTRLNSSHDQSSYAVFCLIKKKYCVYHFKLQSARSQTHGIHLSSNSQRQHPQYN